MLMFFILLLASVGGVNAADDLNITCDGQDILAVNDFDSQDDVLAYDSKTIIVKPDSSVPNQLLRPTVQTAIDEANPGDTLILQGQFVQCHFVVNKPLTIKAYSNSTVIDPCPDDNNPYGSNYFGIFYLSSQASGTIIEGFDFINDDYVFANKIHNPYAIFIDGADNVTIKDCILNWNLNESFLYDGIIIRNSENTHLNNIYLNNTKRGIVIENSSNIFISDSIIENARTSAINVYENSKNIFINNNEIKRNRYSGINLTSAEGIHIINNVIQNNGIGNDMETGSGVYINANVSDSEIKGNLMIKNALHAIMFDYRVRNMGTVSGDENLLVIENNYFVNHKDMVVHRRIFVETSYGDYNYDSVNDIYYHQDGGKYTDSKAIFYMKSAFVVNELVCGFTYYNPISPWGKGDYLLNASLKQVKKGVYNLSFVDKDGFVANDLSSFDVTFYLNNLSGISKTIHIQNGTAIVDFTDNLSIYLKNDNVILAVTPYNDPIILKIGDSDIPTNKISTKLIADKLTTYPLSDAYFKAKLTDENGNVLAKQKVTIKINGKNNNLITDNNGMVKVKVSLTAKKTYTAVINYEGDDKYVSSQATAKIVVKTGSRKAVIKASDMKVKKNAKKTFSFKLTNSAGKALSSQKVTVKLDGKTYNLKTSSNGLAKFQVKLSKIKKYSVSIKFLGNGGYKEVSKTLAIYVTKK